MVFTDLPWIIEARRYEGLAEVPGKNHNPTITHWLNTLKAWWRDDETPWCGTFVAHCCRHAGRALPKHWYRALAWVDAGVRLKAPAYGCIAVFGRKGGGHVGFVVGRDRAGNLLILGGNQGNKVSIAKFERARAVAFVWPVYPNGGGMPHKSRYNLPVLAHQGGYSRNEA
ncbi:TIGR02594 family protein [Neisseria shayeganii]|uniref:TIGR02594 family protein n=1 Tax=Neisseria shayeganii TaxID=607712 RepID=A0A7D7NB25_9NEIS|nr:TIGR02594 family protein [Neisseria shayeganii]QMT39978.1 TIGR02594 family protein [Neisseria shayeganii]